MTSSVIAKKSNHEGGLDRISNLPDCMLTHILSSLPMKDAVSTSLLSTRWRYLYASVFNIDVDFHLIQRSPHTVNSFRNLMDKMLFSQTEGRIEQLRFDHIHTSSIDPLRACEWISAAVWRGVKELDFGFDVNSKIMSVVFPTARLFFSETLVRIKLSIPFSISVPVHVFLPSLKTLELEYIEFEDDDSAQRLISGCPILEDLSISRCDMKNVIWLVISNPSVKSLTTASNYFDFRIGIAIDLPSLVYFKCEKFLAEAYSIVDMRSLVTADFDLSVEDLARAGDHQDALVELFQGIRNVKSLHLKIYPEAVPVLSHREFLAVENLVRLEIHDTYQEWKGTGLFELLEFSPNLQTLVICNVSNDQVLYPEEKVPSCLLYQLKEFKVLDFEDESSLFKMVTYILNNAIVLEKLTICCKGQSLEADEKSRIAKQLLMLPKSSHNCQVVAF